GRPEPRSRAERRGRGVGAHRRVLRGVRHRRRAARARAVAAGTTDARVAAPSLRAVATGARPALVTHAQRMMNSMPRELAMPSDDAGSVVNSWKYTGRSSSAASFGTPSRQVV